jgi:CheY-like chemotaxis protein
LTKLFEENQMKVLRADNGVRGLEILTKETAPIDLVLMDIMMPVMNGFEAIKRIREQEKLKELPVIAVTAKAMRADKENCMKVGANDYVTKPIDIERLFSLMRIWLYR